MELRTKPSVQHGVTHCSYSGDGVMFVEYEPGNGTRYALVLSSLEDLSDEARARMGVSQSSVLLTLVNFERLHGPSMLLHSSGFLAYGYVQEKLGVNLPDAIILAELIGHLLKRPATSCEDYIQAVQEAEKDRSIQDLD